MYSSLLGRTLGKIYFLAGGAEIIILAETVIEQWSHSIVGKMSGIKQRYGLGL